MTNISTGERLLPQKLRGDTVVKFFDDGSFYSVNPATPEVPVFGIWEQRGRRLRFSPDRDVFVANAEYACALGGNPCRILAVTARSISKTNRAGTRIKGEAKTHITMLVNGAAFNLRQSGKFTCRM